MNFVEIAGHLGADAEERFTATGKRVVSLRVATKVRQGGKDETIWWRANIWGDRFDKMIPYLKKGTGVIIFGEMMKPEIYTGKDGMTQVSLTLTAEVVRFSPFGKPQNSSQTSPQAQGAKGGEQTYMAAKEELALAMHGDDSGFTGDDLPF